MQTSAVIFAVINSRLMNIPIYISLLFALITFLSVWIFYKAANESRIALIILSGWLFLQGLLTFSGFYLKTDNAPPRFLLLLFPPLIFIAFLFFSKRGKLFLDQLNQKYLVLLHIIRIPVELILYLLFLHHAVPLIMTFEGWNYDIYSGITAPIIYYIVFKSSIAGKKTMLLIWNFICLCLLINIVAIAILSAPFAFQQFAFEQPNIALLYFPFSWLACCIVPLVLLSHLTAIRQLRTSIKKTNKLLINS
jgi:hypothetical protein